MKKQRLLLTAVALKGAKLVRLLLLLSFGAGRH
ncbi:MAG: hypothetical protein JWQ76_2423 [Ramlibacter sp.]|nr:hypothetical protein [Ramlibacter sp.]